MDSKTQPHIPPKNPRKKLKVTLLVLLCLAVFLLIVLKQCEEELPEPVVFSGPVLTFESELDTIPEDTVLAVDTVVSADTPALPSPPTPKKVPAPKVKKPPPAPEPTVTVEAAPDSVFVYADPWGGRHFDSVSVQLFCRESCLVVFSLEDSVNLKSYEQPISITRNRNLWIAGVDSLGFRSAPVRISYVIEKQQGLCPEQMMPFGNGSRSACMDVYEWPNRTGARPTAYITHQEAADSCAAVGKRLCNLDELQMVCSGPEGYIYPYGNEYNENYCPAKERTARRSGRFPACRSYYGMFDLTGNLWEWTATSSEERSDRFMVAGGNWDTGDQATCRQTKYSFFPQNRYLFVGFRCCQDVK